MPEPDDSDEAYVITEPFDPRQIDISVEVQNVGYLLDLLQERLVDLHSDFQRSSYLWSPAKMSRFIESLIVRLPIPPFYLSTPEHIPATKTNQMQIVDGLQRLSTLNRYVIDKNLRLRGLELLPDLNGQSFDMLARPIQRAIERAQVTVYLIRPNTPKPVKFIIFNRMNTGGLTLNDQEIRHALNPGAPAQYLERLISLHSFRKLIRVKHPRMRDQELALRYVAFRMTPPQKYKRGLKRFLDDAMANIADLPTESRSAFDKDFDASLGILYHLFGPNAFSRKRETRSNLNKAIFDSWTVNIAILGDADRAKLIEKRDLLDKRYAELLSQGSTYDNAISKDTSSPESVRNRFAEIRRLLKSVVHS